MQYFPVSETGVAATPICQYLDRNCLLLAGVSGFDDRETLNLILCYRYVIQYEPFYCKGRLSDFPLTLAYGKKNRRASSQVQELSLGWRVSRYARRPSECRWRTLLRGLCRSR